jgi:hypothetical protein
MNSGGTFDLGAAGDFEKDQKFSYGAWIKAGRNGVSGGILARMDEKNGYRGWDLFQSDSALSVHIVSAWSSEAIKVSTRNAVVKAGTWQHVFVTYDGSGKAKGVKIFVDGADQKLNIDIDTLKPTSSIRTTTALRVGQRSHGQGQPPEPQGIIQISHFNPTRRCAVLNGRGIELCGLRVTPWERGEGMVCDGGCSNPGRFGGHGTAGECMFHAAPDAADAGGA